MFVDTRLHISVRPYLEYVIPDTGLVIRNVLLGDCSRAEALAALERCSKYDTDRETPLSQFNTDDDSLNEIHMLAVRVCTHTNEYVETLKHAWIEYVSSVSTAVRRETRSLNDEAITAKAVYDRYRSVAPDVVETEYRQEVQRISVTLDHIVNKYRELKPPNIERPSSLVDATNELKECFSNAYRQVHTRELIKLKSIFEAHMLDIQRPIAASFLKRMIKFVER